MKKGERITVIPSLSAEGVLPEHAYGREGEIRELVRSNGNVTGAWVELDDYSGMTSNTLWFIPEPSISEYKQKKI